MKVKKIFSGLIILTGFLVTVSSAAVVPPDDIVIGPRINIYTGPRDQGGQTSAYDSVNNRFLVVWDGPDGVIDANIYAQLVNPDGTLYGGTIVITNVSGHQDRGKAAFDPMNKRFLVAWSDERHTIGTPPHAVSCVYGQFVNADGTLNGGNFAISSIPQPNQTKPGPVHPQSVVYDPVLGRFFVLSSQCEDTGNLVYNLYGRFVNPDGTFGSDHFAITAYTDTYGVVSAVALTQDVSNSRFLITFQKFIINSGLNKFAGVILNNDGTAYSGEFDISSQSYPYACFDSINDRFLLLRTVGAFTGARAQLLNADGTLYGSEIVISQANPFGVYSAAFDKASSKFFVVGTESGGVFGQLINPDGTLYGTRFMMTDIKKEPFINFGSGQSGSLIVWWDIPFNTGSDIFGKFVKTTSAAAPVLEPIGNKQAREGDMLEFIIDATDANNDSLTYSAGNLPVGATFDPVNRIFRWTPTYDQAGVYNNIHFEVSDGVLTDSEDITITVTNVNRPPVLGAIGNKLVNEGVLLEFTVSATDPDGNALTYSASNLPPGAVFGPDTRKFSWRPTHSQAGTYSNVHFQVSDGSSIDFEDITIIVRNVNTPPVLAPIGNKSVNEGATLQFTISATDAEGDALTYSAGNLPQGAAFDPQTRTFTWQPNYQQSGTYNNIYFRVTDGALTDGEVITITVNNVNAPPEFDPDTPSEFTIKRIHLLSFWVHATDPEGGRVSYRIIGKQWNAFFLSAWVYNCKKHRLLWKGHYWWRPNVWQAGDFMITIIASDKNGNEVAKTITIHVKNDPPTLKPIGNKTVTATASCGTGILFFRVCATDTEQIDIAGLKYYADGLPPGANLFTHAGWFYWDPTPAQRGTYTVRFYVKDYPGLMDEETITITVL